MGFIAGLMGAGKDALNTKMEEKAAQEATQMNLSVQQYLHNFQGRKSAKREDEARMAQARALTAAAGQPEEAWTHAYEMLMAGLTPSNIESKLADSTWAPTVMDTAVATPVEGVDQAEATPAPEAPAEPQQLSDFLGQQIGNIFNRNSGNMDTAMSQAAQTVGVSQAQFDDVIANPVYSPPSVTHTGSLEAKLAAADPDDALSISWKDETGREFTRDAVRNQDGTFTLVGTNETIDIEPYLVRTSDEQDGVNKLLTLNNKDIMDAIEAQAATISTVDSYKRLYDYVEADGRILTGVSGLMAGALGLGREIATAVDLFGDTADDTVTSAEQFTANMFNRIAGEDNLEMTRERSLFLTELSTAAFRRARTLSGTGVLSNRDVAAAFDQLKGNSNDQETFLRNMLSLSNEAMTATNTQTSNILRSPAVSSLIRRGEDNVRTALAPVEDNMSEAILTWLQPDLSDANNIPEPEEVSADQPTAPNGRTDEDIMATTLRTLSNGVLVHDTEAAESDGFTNIYYSIDGKLYLTSMSQADMQDPNAMAEKLAAEAMENQ